ncbi:MAG: translation initiation factor IF-2 [Candidatus Pacebacteria bacterium]|nr:translation initiation factor IF-2 [Candidatus Paceibacterota bacterium]
MTIEDKKENLKLRPPVVVVMGHVDHGKTSLLDYIRKTGVALREAGGITQSVGAYEIEHNGKKITFIDTPGHEAFTNMRSRGADVADFAILVVAADDGVKPQTKESISILKESKTPFVVAINKIDKNNADIEKAKQDLLVNEVLLEGFGGNISWQAISAKTGEGISELLDLVLLVAEMENFSYDPEKNAEGFVIEAKLDKNRGNEVFVILKDGTLKSGQDIVSGSSFGKIKILENFKGEKVNSLVPSSPALIVGFESLPKVGDKFMAGFTDLLEISVPPKNLATDSKNKIVSSEEGEKINLILKADTSGTLEALFQVISALPVKEDLSFKIIDKKVGDITDGDVKEALNPKSIIIGFNVKTNKAAENLARSFHIEIISSKIIYELVKSLEEKISAFNSSKNHLSRLSVLATFSRAGSKETVGGRVEEGIFKKNVTVEVKRNGETLGRAKIVNLQCDKHDVNQVDSNKECGLVLELLSDFSVEKGDEFIF